ncbi:Hydrolases acting on ester bond [Citrus sinensis]|nr:Hydrolases acting on ester bond [Citrus sinensis]
MEGFRAKLRVATTVILALWIGIAALYSLLKPISNGCVMTYMYPTYIPISSTEGASSSARYALYLYHEGWKKIDFEEHLKQLNGVPVLFIPGNAVHASNALRVARLMGDEVRSLAAESDRAYQGGPLEHSFYQEASLTLEEGGVNIDASIFHSSNQYTRRLDWFAVDLEGEHSAMDGQILEEHAEYVVYAIHRILDQYRESQDAREREGAATSGSLPKSVILVGHSVGGFVARAAIIHPLLRKSAVETVLTLSSPHQSPPLALQPSLGNYFARVNDEWRKGYEAHTTPTGHRVSNSRLSHVVVVSISAGYHDYQVRSKIESLDGIVPPTHGFMISSTGMKNVWLSMEHQAILWCNQLVVQVSHTLLSLIDSRTGQPFLDTRQRLAMFSRMLRSGTPQSFNWMMQSHLFHQSTPASIKDAKDATGSQAPSSSSCPSTVQWSAEGLDKDLYIQTATVTVLAMDGKRRWLDIQKLGANGKDHFIFVTNLAPCTGVRIHLWPEKGKSTTDLPGSKRILEVTSKMVHIPSRAAPRQLEPGSQTEQAPPSAVFQLGPEDMRGFRFLTISVAPTPTISGRPPPAVSMAVGQFFNPQEGEREFSSQSMLLSAYSPKDLFLKEDHPLVFNLTFAISLGLLPITLSLRTASCGIQNSGFANEEAGDIEHSRLCKMRCFPPVALAWDPTSGLYVFPNLFSETIIIDSSPALWSYSQGSEKTIVVLLVDPHCSYKTSVSVSVTAAASRFLLLYGSQIAGLSVAVVFFALMRQAYAWDYYLPMPSMLTVVEYNLQMPFPFLLLAILPILVSLFHSFLMSQPFPPIMSFAVVSLICYVLANGLIALLILVSQLVFYVTATAHVFIKTRWEVWEGNFCFAFLLWFVNLSSSFFSLKVVRVMRANQLLVTALAAITLVCFVHPALGLIVILLSHAFCCHTSLSSFLTASFRSHAWRKELYDYNTNNNGRSKLRYTRERRFSPNLPLDDCSSSSPDSSKTFSDTQLEIFHHRHGLLILHLLASLMFVPSLMAWFQRISMGHSFPWFLDSVLCIGVILHGTVISKPEYNYLVSFPGILGQELRLNSIYLLAGYYSFLSGLALAPYRVFYAMAAIGVISLASKIIKEKYGKGEPRFGGRKHSHRH